MSPESQRFLDWLREAEGRAVTFTHRDGRLWVRVADDHPVDREASFSGCPLSADVLTYIEQDYE